MIEVKAVTASSLAAACTSGFKMRSENAPVAQAAEKNEHSTSSVSGSITFGELDFEEAKSLSTSYRGATTSSAETISGPQSSADFPKARKQIASQASIVVCFIRIVLDRVLGSGMKAPEGAANTLRHRKATAVDPVDPLPDRSIFSAWAASLTLDDLAGLALIFGGLFALLTLGGW